MEITLSPQQVKAAIMLVEGRPKKAVAKKIGVTPQTISEWHKNPHFLAHLNRLKTEALDAALDNLRNLAGEAVETLRDLMKNSSNDETRRKAAIDVLEMVGVAGAPAKFLWRVGPTDPVEIEARAKMEKVCQATTNQMIATFQ